MNTIYSIFDTISNLYPHYCKHLVFSDDRRCIDCGYQLPTEFKMDIYVDNLSKPSGFVLINTNSNPNLTEARELINDQVESIPSNFRFILKDVPISKKQELYFKTFEVYRANRDKILIQSYYDIL